MTLEVCNDQNAPGFRTSNSAVARPRVDLALALFAVDRKRSVRIELDLFTREKSKFERVLLRQGHRLLGVREITSNHNGKKKQNSNVSSWLER